MKNKSDTQLAQILWDYNNIETPLEKADIIIGLGSNDKRIATHSSKLLLEHYAKFILFTGAYGILTRGHFQKTEAEVFADIATKLGIPKNKILIENKAENTGENALYSKKLVENKKIAANKIILVTRPYNLRRAYATFDKFWPGNKLIMSPPKISYQDRSSEVGEKKLINILVATTQRIIIYPEKGFQIPQEMPDEVKNAYEELVKRGYTEQLVE